jgi:glutaminyl-peptide cyclotransferase
MPKPSSLVRFAAAGFLALACAACGSSATSPKPSDVNAAAASAPALAATVPATSSTVGAGAAGAQTAEAAPPLAQTGGFDGAAAYAQVAKLVSFGPHPPASDAIRAVQGYIRGQLQSFGCTVETDDFHAETPIGSLAMQNIVAKVPGTGPGIILLLTHYDTLRLDGFVGAEDAGSSTGLMLEIARNLCKAPKRENAVWIAFLDGEENQRNVATEEEAQHTWYAGENTFGSRELAARMAVSGDLKRTRAVILADMIGQYNLHILREQDSTKWLKDVVWNTAARLGYKQIFLSQESTVSDDHDPFLQRGVPAIDIIDLEDYIQEGYWHTRQDTLDKVSPRSLAIVGHVILESVAELQARK